MKERQKGRKRKKEEEREGERKGREGKVKGGEEEEKGREGGRHGCEEGDRSQPRKLNSPLPTHLKGFLQDRAFPLTIKIQTVKQTQVALTHSKQLRTSRLNQWVFPAAIQMAWCPGLARGGTCYMTFATLLNHMELIILRLQAASFLPITI